MSSKDVKKPIYAILCDLDGVITQTANLHAKAWKLMFDEFLKQYEKTPEKFHAFDISKDYPEYVDGKPRTEGIKSYLTILNIDLPNGAPDDPPRKHTIQGLSKRKNEIFHELLEKEGIEVYPKSIEQLKRWKQEGIKTAVVSSSKNCRTILKLAKIEGLFDVVVDGITSQQENLKGKPEPDTFLYASKLLDTDPTETMVVEDALAGIAAGKKGGFGLVVGIMRNNSREALLELGADCVVKNLEEINTENSGIKIYPVSLNPWYIIREGFNPARERIVESILSFGNGFIGSRNSLEEYYSISMPLTAIAGVYENTPGTTHNELSKAFDWTRIQLFHENDLIDLTGEKILTHKRYLDLKKGLVIREWKIQDNLGRITFIKITKFISLNEKHLAYKSILIQPENHSGTIKVITGIDTSIYNSTVLIPEEETMAIKKTDSNLIAMSQKSRFSHHNVTYRKNKKNKIVYEEWKWKGEPGKEYVIESLVGIFLTTSNEDAFNIKRDFNNLSDKVFKKSLLLHIDTWKDFWQRSGIQITGNIEAQRWVNFALYNLIHNGKFSGNNHSIGARGLSGISYQGHVFWDTEIYLLPFYIFSAPEIARSLLMYRYNTLNGARENARREGHKGTCFAWESTDSGLEMTPLEVISPYGEVLQIYSSLYEIHITPDIAYAVWQYWTATKDEEFMIQYGSEILFETARFCAGYFKKGDDELYHILDVVGPDEYHERINDNAYTNLLAQYNLEIALKMIDLLNARFKDKYEKLKEKINLQEEEIEEWKKIKENVYTGFNSETNIYEQFKGFSNLEYIDLEKFEPRTMAMDVILGGEKTKASQIIKQADVLMILFLLRDRFKKEVIEANFNYYEPRTSHGSSLSPSIHSILAANLGKHELAYRYFEQNALIDLDDKMGNAAGGIHIASIGGTWMSVVMGFAGMQVCEEGLKFDPNIPELWQEFQFSIYWRNQKINILLKKNIIEFEVTGYKSVQIQIGEQKGYRELIPGKLYESFKDYEWKWKN